MQIFKVTLDCPQGQVKTEEFKRDMQDHFITKMKTLGVEHRMGIVTVEEVTNEKQD